MNAGDYVDKNMKYLGNDGNLGDGKVYLVTDKKEKTLISNNDEGGRNTELGDVKSAIELPGENVRAEMGAAVDRSNNANTDRTDGFKGDDNEGGFHEEGGIYGRDYEGKQQAVPAKPGHKTEPGQGVKAQVDMEDRADPGSPYVKREGSYHVHPSGSRRPPSNVIGGETRSFDPDPTDPDDYNVAGHYPGNSYVLAPGYNSVTIIKGTGKVSEINNLKKFTTYRAR